MDADPYEHELLDELLGGDALVDLGGGVDLGLSVLLHVVAQLLIFPGLELANLEGHLFLAGEGLITPATFDAFGLHEVDLGPRGVARLDQSSFHRGIYYRITI